MRAWLLVAAVAACSSNDTTSVSAPATDREAAPAPPPALDAAPIEAAAEVDVDCDTYHVGLAGRVGRTLRAAGGDAYYEGAVEALDAGPAACRDGRWYVAAARLLRYDDRAIAGLTSAHAALTRGLAAAPSRELFAVVAFLAPLGSGPELPADACERVRAAPPVPGPPYESDDRAHYVCGHAALAAGRWREAETELSSITMARHYPDLALRRAQAARCAGTRDRRLERDARRLDPTVSLGFGANPREHQALRDAARPGDLRQLSCARAE